VTSTQWAPSSQTSIIIGKRLLGTQNKKVIGGLEMWLIDRVQGPGFEGGKEGRKEGRTEDGG
jgi:hypothetical protein